MKKTVYCVKKKKSRQLWSRFKKGVQSILCGPLIKMIDDSKRSTYLNQVQAINMETDKHTDLH